MTETQNKIDSLLPILRETISEQKSISKLLQSCPEDAAMHRVNAMYLGKILDIRKVISQERAMDRDQLLLDALMAVVEFLIEKEEVDCARFIGDHLEVIGMKVKSNWKDFKGCPDSPPDTKTSANSSSKESSRLTKQSQTKKEHED